MPAFSRKNPLFLYVPIAVIGSFLLSYYAIGREMNMILVGLVAVFLFIICFFSVKISLVLLIFSMLLSPELEVGQTAKREITLRAEDLLLTVMTMGWFFRMAMYKDIGFAIRNPLNRPIFIYCSLAIISTGVGIMRGNVNLASGILFTLKLIEYFFLFYVVINYVREERDINLLVSSMLIVAAIISVYALISIGAGGAGGGSAPFEGKTAERNTLSGYLVLMSSIAGGILLNSPSKFEKWAIGLFLPLVLAVLLFSISRSGWVSALVAVAVLFVVSRKKSLFFIFICIGIALLPFLFPDVARERIDYTFHQYGSYIDKAQQFTLFGYTLDTSASARIFSALIVLRRFWEHPFLGFGITGFSFIDGQYIRTLAEMGVFGLCAFVWVMASVHSIIRKIIRLDLSPRLSGVALGFYAGFWGMITHALTSNTFIIVRIAEPFWCVAGILVVSLMKYNETLLLETGGIPAAAGALDRKGFRPWATTS